MKFSLNDPRTWGSIDVMKAPPFDVSAFQRKIDAILGLSASGHSIIRLVWPGQKECYSQFYNSWDKAGFGIKTELRAKYRFATVEVNKRDYIDIPLPRWVLEQRVEPAQYISTWEASRWQAMPMTGEEARDLEIVDPMGRPSPSRSRPKVERRPPAPLDGYYFGAKTIAQHEQNMACCKRRKKRGEICYGRYRVPGRVDLDAIAEARAHRDADPNWSQNPNEPISEETLNAIEHQTADLMAEYKARKERINREFADEHGLEMLTEILGIDPKTKAFAYPGNGSFTKTRSGILIPNN